MTELIRRTGAPKIGAHEISAHEFGAHEFGAHEFGAHEISAQQIGEAIGRTFSPAQVGVIEADLEPTVVVAGAGSGKTATMVGRVLWALANRLVTPDQVLGLTFTTKAAEELAVRTRAGIRSLVASGVLEHDPAMGEPTISTYHAYAGRIVREHALRAGREPSARVITPATSWLLASRTVAGYDGPMEGVEWQESTVVVAMLQLAGDLAEHLVTAQDVRDVGQQWRDRAAATAKVLADGRKVLTHQETREKLLPLIARYEQIKRERDVLDFGDVVALAAALARDHDEVSALERSSFRLVLLDEYQDTGSAQEVLLSSLFKGSAVTGVGDPCQSIYGWRGASSGTLRRFAERFDAADGARRSLATSYRSGGHIITIANALAGPLRADGTLPVEPLEPAPGRETDGLVRCALLHTVDDEATWVAAQVKAAVEALPEPDEGEARWSRSAVLCRKRNQFARIREAFDALGVPVEVVGIGGLLEVPEVSDVVATMRVVADPTADAALLRLLTGPRWSIGPRDLQALGRRARRLARGGDRPEPDPIDAVVLGIDDGQAGSLADALDDLGPAGEDDPFSVEGRARLERLRDELRGLRWRADAPLPDLVADIERTLGIDVELLARPHAHDAAAARADLDAFGDAAATFAGETAADGDGRSVLLAFLAFLDAAEEEERGLDLAAVSGADTVKVMTVHAAKGLEWPVVAVPGLAKSTDPRGGSIFPGKPVTSTTWTKNARLLPFELRGDRDDLPTLSGLDKESMAAHFEAVSARDALEERRLGYVAMTRAETVLLCSGYHWGDNQIVLGPSEFLQEVRAQCELGAGEIDGWVEIPAEENPVTVDVVSTPWPAAEPLAGERVQDAAAAVRALLAAGPDAIAEALQEEPDQHPVVATWDDDIARLREEAERARERSARAVLPAQVSVSTLVELQRDPASLARSLLRPLPRRPSPVTRRGTAFHAWLEQVYEMPQLLDPEELPGSADVPAGVELTKLQDAFRASPWWGRTPLEVEVPFETLVGPLVVRGRADAVFADLDRADGFIVVDWKTGRRPTGPDAAAAAVQLAAYRLAFARLRDIDVDRVRAAFHYVASNETVEPASLLDEAGLERLVLDLPETA